MQKTTYTKINRVILIVFTLISLWLLLHYIFYSAGEKRFYKALDIPTKSRLLASRRSFKSALKIFPGNRKAEKYIRTIDNYLRQKEMSASGEQPQFEK